MAGIRRVRTRFCEIRHAPRARKIVSTTGSSSGNVAIAIVIPAKKPFLPGRGGVASTQGVGHDNDRAQRQTNHGQIPNQSARLNLQQRPFRLDAVNRLADLP